MTMWGDYGRKEEIELTWFDGERKELMDQFISPSNDYPDKVIVIVYDGTATKMEEWIIPINRVVSIDSSDHYYDSADVMTSICFEYMEPPYYQNFFPDYLRNFRQSA